MLLDWGLRGRAPYSPFTLLKNIFMKKKHLITTVINYCSNDYRFIKKCAEEAFKFSHEVIIPVSDHFFNGTKENRKLLDLTYFENPKCKFIEYKFYKDKTYSNYKWFSPSSVESRHLWHSTSRYISYFFWDKATEYVLFLDADEICDGDIFLKWLDLEEYKKYSAMRIGSYMYFNSPQLRSLIIQKTSLFVKKESFDRHLLLEEKERKATYDFSKGKKHPMILNANALPLIHHYSWVRTKEETLRKTETWGHFSDKNWQELINKNYGNIDKEKEPYYDLPLEQASDCFFNPLAVEPDLTKKTPKKFNNVKKISYRDILEKELTIDHCLKL